MRPYPWGMKRFCRVEEGSPGAGEHDHTERRHVLDSTDKKAPPPDESDIDPSLPWKLHKILRNLL